MRTILTAALCVTAGICFGGDGNRLTWLEENNPWYPHTGFPKLTTPQWVGEDGVEAVVVLAIDDMRDTARYENYLRPIVQRLKQIDGRAPVSIMTCNVKPDDPQLQSWLEEGLSIDVHTVDHPCPLLNGGNFDRAKSTYDRCVDLLSTIPGNRPVAFRMPCCDSLNTVSPRFFSEIFNSTTENGRFLSISSSVFNVFTSEDETIPRDLIRGDDGKERFRKYFPKGLKRGNVEHSNFVNWIENYPYPYVINGRCWEFPCVVPSDWEAQFLQQPNNPDTVRDMKAALDITVQKQGVFNLVFHPHGWIKAEQVVEIIDHAVETHGNKVKFLTFREALDRLNQNLLGGESLRADDGGDAGIRLLDINDDGFQDVVIGSESRHLTRIWRPRSQSWREASFPVRVGEGVQFTLVREDGRVSVLSPTIEGPATKTPTISHTSPERAWYFDGNEWRRDDYLQSLVSFSRRGRFEPVEREDAAGPTQPPGARSWRFRDVDHDGRCEAIVSWQTRNEDGTLNSPQRADVNVFHAVSLPPPNGSPPGQGPIPSWQFMRFAWPSGSLDAKAGNDPALFRFADLDGDGQDDLIASTEAGTTVALFEKFGLNGGWSRIVLNVDRESDHSLPPIIRADGSDNGFFFHSGNLCWQNEDTDHLPDLIRRVPIKELLTQRRAYEASQKTDKPVVLIGAASVDITPRAPVRLAGYAARKTLSEGVALPIHAKAFVFGGTEKHLLASWRRGFLERHIRTRDEFVTPELTVMLSVDNCGIPASLTEKLFAALQKRWGLKRERFAVSSTHTHSGPWLHEFAPLQFQDVPDEHLKAAAEYEDELFRKLQHITTEAITKRFLGRLAYGQTEVSFARNRRSIQSGKWVGFGDVPDGPVDHRVSVLVGLNTGYQPMAVLANYACHCTTVGGDFNQVSGDWATVAANRIQDGLKNNTAMITIGAGADANPQPRGEHEMTEQHGRALGDAVLNLLERRLTAFSPDGTGFAPGSLKYIDPRAVCRLERIDLPFGPIPTREQFEADAERGGATAARAQKFLDMLDRGEAIPQAVRDYPVGVWSFGDDLSMVFLGGEVVVDYAVRMADEFDSDRLWLTAYSNAMPCYIPSKRILREGGYEADSSMRYYAQPTRLAPETEDIILDTVQKLLPAEFYSKEKQQDFPPPKSPEESAAAIQMRPGLRVELVAAEPLISDPVAFEWDINGRLYVVEMGDYPSGGDTSGRVRLLEDSDGDGQYDKATTFLDGLGFPTGVHRWRNGVVITAAPEILYAEDSDGDGVADIRKTLFQGFAEGNQQHRVNGLRYGLDHQLYVANGDSGGTIKNVGAVIDSVGELAQQSLSISGRDLRIKPDEGLMEPQSGQTQFGRCRDDWGNWFGCNNSRPIWHFVLPDHYLRRNPHLAVRDTRHEVSVTPGAAPVFPVSRTLARFNDFGKANRFTSACSTTIYRDRMLGDEFYGNAFVCEPVHNLVSRLVLQSDGLTFKGQRAEDEQQSEFLASSDNWFRPVMVRTGPDGALWVADMYRFVIEHPKWIPAEWQRRLDLQAGSDRGRIYRIVRDERVACCGAQTNETTAAKKSDDESEPAQHDRSWLTASWNRVPRERLVQRLNTPNGWWRDAIQRILIHRDARDSVPALETLAQHAEQPAARVQALGTLAGLHELKHEVIMRALKDEHSGIRRQALRLLHDRRDHLKGNELPQALVNDAPQVQLQLAFTLGIGGPDNSLRTLAELAVKHRENGWMQSAIASSLTDETAEKFLLLLEERGATGSELFGRYINHAVALSDADGVANTIQQMLSTANGKRDSAAWTTIGQIVNALRNHSAVLERVEKSDEWGVTRKNAAELIVDAAATHQSRVAGIRIVSLEKPLDDNTADALGSLLSPQFAPELQLASVAAIAGSGRTDAANRLLTDWRAHTPRVRTAIVDSLLQRESSRSHLLKAIERGDVSAADLDASRRESLLNSGSDESQTLARRLLLGSSSSTRAQIVEQHRSALELEPSVERGVEIFRKRCASCHRLRDIGKSIGANLASLRDRSGPALLTAILDPNRAVEAKFLSYSAVTSDGRTFNGMLLNETGNNITLAGADGKEHVLLRQDLETLVATGRSLMPEGLEKDLNPQDLADVMAFVQQSGSPSKQFPGNSPVTVRPGDDGTVTLPATAAAVYGPSLVFESKYRNLGFWHSKDDQAVWTIELPASGTYEVEFDFACDNSTAGNVVLLATDGRELRGSVPGTGSWDDYRRWTPGTIDLRRGTSRLVVSSPAPRGYVIDLRAIRLRPRQ